MDAVAARDPARRPAHHRARSRTIAPRHDTKWAQALGIVGRSRRSRPSTRRARPASTNIHRGADLLNNTVVEPGQIFSLNETIGPRTAERGFVAAPVFAEGEFFDDYGGGVSQLATTTYNAGFFGGYEDVTHQPHTIYIYRYPAGPRSHRQLRRHRPPVPQRHDARRPHPHLLQRHVDHRHALRRQRRPHRPRGEPDDHESGAGHRQDRSRARRRRRSTRTTSARR